MKGITSLRWLLGSLAFVTLASLIGVVASVVHAETTITVNTTADELNSNGNCSLREAIRAANTDTAVDACPAGSGPDVIQVPAGTITLAIPGVDENDGLTGDFDITSDLSIHGAGATLTILDGNLLDRIFEVVGSPAVNITDLTVQHGYHGDVWPDDEPLGAGIRINAGQITLDRTQFINNTGHAIGNAGGDLILSNSLVADNTAEAVGSGGGGTLTIINTTITRNHHRTWCCGGGGVVADGTTLIIGSTISDNSSTSGGGGILNWRQMTIIDSTITGNYTAAGGPSGDQGPGGGINNTSGATLTVINSTISNNSARGSGGGINTNSVPEGLGIVNLYNVTITNNTADSDHNGVGDAGGLMNGENNDSAPVTIRNTIIANNIDLSGGAMDCAGPLTSQGYNLIRDPNGCTILGDETGNLYGVDPLLGPLQDNGGPSFTHALLPGSPAIDAVNPAAPGSGGNACEPTDQRGVARPQDGDGDGLARCDMGAFELAAVTPPVLAVNVDIKPGSTTNPINLQSRGVIPVAILSTATFDAATIDPASVTFGPSQATSTQNSLEDVNGDGRLDLVLHFRTQQTGIQPGDTQACLTGETTSGVPIQGCDTIHTRS